MTITVEYMRQKYGKNWDVRPHSKECDCDWCYEWAEDWRQYEDRE